MKFEYCLECGNEIGKYGKKFCSNRCSAIYNNRKRCKSQRICIYCGDELGKTAKKYCSGDCHRNHCHDKMIRAWEEGEYSGTIRRGLSRTIRDYLLRKNNYKCSRCGWGEINPFTNTSTLEIDHKDGNAYNNRPENLEVLCPNCHSLSKYYRGANRGNGRRTYLKKYYIRGSNGKVI